VDDEAVRRFLVVGVLLTAWVSAPTAAVATPAGWKLVKRGTSAGPGQLAVVGSIVRQPGRVAFRATVASPGTVSLTVVMSCRKGLATRIGRQRLVGAAPYTKVVSLPLAGADNCAVSATGVNPAGTLRLDLLRSA
jgi:hypothetical protein